MRPGIRTRPPQSTIRTSESSGASAGSTALMVLPSTTTLKPCNSVSDLPSNSRALVKRYARERRAEAPAAVLPEPEANAPSIAIDEWRREFFREMRVQPRERRRVAEAPSRSWRFVVIRRACEHSRFPGLSGRRGSRGQAKLCWIDRRPAAIRRKARVFGAQSQKGSRRRGRVGANELLALELRPQVGGDRMAKSGQVLFDLGA